MTVRGYQVRFDTLNEKERTVEAVIATETPVVVYDYNRWEPVCEVLLMSGVVLPENRQVPLLDSHNRSSVAAIVGSSRNVRVVKESLVATNHYANNQSGVSAFELMRDGHLTDNSVGYRVLNYTTIEKGKTSVVDGRTFTAPKDRALRVSTRWELKENSIVPIAADSNAKNRAENETANAGLKQRNLKLFKEIRTVDFEKWLTERGFKLEGLSDDQAAALRADYDKQQAQTRADNVEEPDETRNNHNIGEQIQKGAELERSRVAQIRQLADGSAIPDELVERMITDGKSVTEAQTEFFGALRTAQLRAGVGSAPMGIVRTRQINTTILEAGLLLRAGMDDAVVKVFGEQTANQADEIRDIDLRSVCAEALSLEGRTVPRGRDEMIRAAFSTQSLPTILGNVAKKSLMKGYNLAGATWDGWTTPGTASDFKTMTRVRDTDTGALEKVANGGEIKYGGTSEEKEQFNVDTYAKNFGISRQDIINDDLGVFTRKPMKMGQKAMATVHKLVYTHLLANGNMDDATALFHSDHGNLNTTSPLGADKLAAAIAAMRVQVDSDNEPINIEPAYLIVPPELENLARGLLESDMIMATDGSASTKKHPVKNIFKGLMTPIIDPRLSNLTYTGYSATTWYLAANGTFWDTVEVAFLNGKKEPTLERFNAGPDVQGLIYQVYIDCGVKSLDWRTLQKNTA